MSFKETLGIRQLKSAKEIEKKKGFIEKLITGKRKPKILQTEYGILNVDGKWFKPEYSDTKHKWVFVEVDKPKLDEKINKIIEKLKPAINPEQILRDALFDMDLIELQKLYENLFEAKRKAKPKERPGCVEIKVGDIVVPIRG